MNFFLLIMTPLKNMPAEINMTKTNLISVTDQIGKLAGMLLNLNSDFTFKNDTNSKLLIELQNNTEMAFGKLKNILNSNNVDLYFIAKNEPTQLIETLSIANWEKSFTEPEIYNQNMFVNSPILFQDSFVNNLQNQINRKTIKPLNKSVSFETDSILSTNNNFAALGFAEPIIKKAHLASNKCKPYESVIEKYLDPNDFFHLDVNITDLHIKNEDEFKHIKFYYQRFGYITTGSEIYKYKRGNDSYLIADNGVLYFINSDNMLVPGVFKNKPQHWIQKPQ